MMALLNNFNYISSILTARYLDVTSSFHLKQNLIYMPIRKNRYEILLLQKTTQFYQSLINVFTRNLPSNFNSFVCFINYKVDYKGKRVVKNSCKNVMFYPKLQQPYEIFTKIASSASFHFLFLLQVFPLIFLTWSSLYTVQF